MWTGIRYGPDMGKVNIAYTKNARNMGQVNTCVLLFDVELARLRYNILRFALMQTETDWNERWLQ